MFSVILGPDTGAAALRVRGVQHRHAVGIVGGDPGQLGLHTECAGAVEAPRPGTVICHRPLPMTRLGDCLYIIADDLAE